MTAVKPCCTVALLLAALVAIGCSDEPAGVVVPDGVRITGNVEAYICAPTDVINQGSHPNYAVQTGRQATITAIPYDTLRLRETFRTLNEAWFARELAPGWYRLWIETDHTIPDVIDSVPVFTDTSVFPYLRYDFSDPDTLDIVFTMSAGSDRSRASDMERRCIDTLNVRLGYRLNTANAVFTESVEGSSLRRRYAVPRRPQYRLWEIVYRLDDAMTAPFLPDNMTARPRRFDRCPAAYDWPDSLR